MLKLDTLIVKAPPAPVSDRPPVPTTAMDKAILRVLTESGQPCRPGDIAKTLDATPREVSARLGILVHKNLINRHAKPGAPRRGPGAFLYSARSASDE